MKSRRFIRPPEARGDNLPHGLTRSGAELPNNGNSYVSESLLRGRLLLPESRLVGGLLWTE